jgi:hypothetical protein
VADDSGRPNIGSRTLAPSAYLLASKGESQQTKKKATGENTPMAINSVRQADPEIPTRSDYTRRTNLSSSRKASRHILANLSSLLIGEMHLFVIGIRLLS